MAVDETLGASAYVNILPGILEALRAAPLAGPTSDAARVQWSGTTRRTPSTLGRKLGM